MSALSQNANELSWRTGLLLGVGHAEKAYKVDGINRTEVMSKPHCGNQSLYDGHEESSVWLS